MRLFVGNGKNRLSIKRHTIEVNFLLSPLKGSRGRNLCGVIIQRLPPCFAGMIITMEMIYTRVIRGLEAAACSMAAHVFQN